MSTSNPKKPRPDPDHPPIPPSSWAKKTGFRPKFSGPNPDLESGQAHNEPGRVPPPQNEMGRVPPAQNEPGRVPPAQNEMGRAQTAQNEMGRAQTAHNEPGRVQTGQGEPGRVRRAEGEMGRVQNGGGVNGGAVGMKRREEVPGQQRSRRAEREEEEDEDDGGGFVSRQMHMKYELRDSPGLVPIGFYGLQHFMSILGSLILIPLVIVPAMGGSYEDTANVVSTVLFVTGLTTIIHTTFGSRLPLIQGPSFVYLAPALVIINSSEFLGLNGNNFKHIMKELQGAIIISSAFQAILGYSGLMTMFVRLINPVVVAPTIAAVGLSFYSYGFPKVGTCIEIGAVQILIVIIFSLYLRKISVFGNRVFLIYAVPLGLGITWAIAFLLTQAGAYNYKGCDVNVPESNIISEHCRKHVSRMKQCRVDTSHALNESPWFRFPYPLQWGMPVFNWKMALFMCVVSFISSVDSVGSYHASSLLVASRPPTPGVVSRGIGVEGLCSVLAGLWGTGTGSSTLTENVHTIAVTKMGSRRAVELGACILIVLSLIGKVGGFIASIPEVMVAGLLCFMWAMLTALGLSNLRYSEAGSSRNIIIVGLSLFFSLSIPAYFQQYGISPNTNLPVPSYFQPYIVASHGPIRTQFGGLNYFMNTVLSLHMVVAFLIAVILDNTVPGSKQERGVYVWSESEAARREPAVAKDYELPFRVGRVFRWVKWVGI